MGKVKSLVLCVIGFTSFIVTFTALAKLIQFLSSPVGLSGALPHKTLRDAFANKAAATAFFTNVGLSAAFGFVHSLLNANAVKGFWDKLGLGVAHRSIYNLASSYFILLLVKHWVPSPIALWEFNLDSDVRYWFHLGLHALCWLLIYSGSLLMDLPDLLGIKQIFYEIQGLHQPGYYKSKELNKFYSRVRHPSFICLTLILWTTNCMTLDRIVLATLWTLYMYLAWNPDQSDLDYQRMQFRQKRAELQRL